MDELESLKAEIKVLNKRISHLENQEHKRNALKRLRFVFKILILLAIGYGIWYAYDYMTNYIPNEIENGINKLIPDVFK